MNKKKWIKRIGYVLTALAFVYIFYSLYHVRGDILRLDNIRQILLICGLFALLYTTTVYVFGYLLKLNLEFVSKKRLSALEPIEVFTKSNLCKYLPGNVMQFVARNLYAEKMGITQAQMTVSSLIEIFFNLSVSLVLCLLFARELFFAMANAYVPLAAYALVGVGLVIAGVLALFLLRNTRLFKKLKETVIEQVRNIKKFAVLSLKMFLGISCVHLLAGTLFFYLLRTVTGAQVNFFLVIPAYIITWLIGYIAPSAPGGIGVKEALLSLILMDFYGREQVLIAALLFRITTITSDVLAFCLTQIISKWRSVK